MWMSRHICIKLLFSTVLVMVLLLVFFPSPPLRELKGVVTSLSSDGHLLCSYMGTDPSFFSTPKVDAREADYEQVEAEMKKLQKLIREATRTQGRVLAPPIRQVISTVTVDGAVFRVFRSNCRHPA